MSKENQEAQKEGNLGSPGTRSPGQILVSGLQGPRLSGLRCIYAAWSTEDPPRPSSSMSRIRSNVHFKRLGGEGERSAKNRLLWQVTYCCAWWRRVRVPD